MTDDELRAELRRRNLWAVTPELLRGDCVLNGWEIADDTDPLRIRIVSHPDPGAPGRAAAALGLPLPPAAPPPSPPVRMQRSFQ